jgi:hypothetical protein
MKIDQTTGTWQDNLGCPINITLVSTSDDAIVKNCWRRQSTRDKAEGKVDDDRQDNRADDAGQGAPKVDCD